MAPQGRTVQFCTPESSLHNIPCGGQHARAIFYLFNVASILGQGLNPQHWARQADHLPPKMPGLASHAEHKHWSHPMVSIYLLQITPHNADGISAEGGIYQEYTFLRQQIHAFISYMSTFLTSRPQFFKYYNWKKKARQGESLSCHYKSTPIKPIEVDPHNTVPGSSWTMPKTKYNLTSPKFSRHPVKWPS